MPFRPQDYSPEFRGEIGDLVRAGRDPDDLARKFKPTSRSILGRVARTKGQRGTAGGNMMASRDSLPSRRLVRERDRSRPVRLVEFNHANQAVFLIATLPRVPGVSEAAYHVWRYRPAIGSRRRHRQHFADEAGAGRPCQFAPDVRDASDARRALGLRSSAWAQAPRAADANGEPYGYRLASRHQGDNHTAV